MLVPAGAAGGREAPAGGALAFAAMPPCPPVLVTVVRDGVVESVHRGHVAVATPDGAVVAALGDPSLGVYVRSAAKPLQALATLELLASAGRDLDDVGLAMACASHTGTDTHQIEAAHLLALADLDEMALQTPPALPEATVAGRSQTEPTTLAHNCSGKHAAFLLAHTATGGDPATYLDLVSPLQQAVRRHLAEVAGAEPQGPGIDGCGAPAWLLPLSALATAFARLAAAERGSLARVRRAMAAHPELVGGDTTDDTRLMRADARVVAKRGAEGVLAAGFRADRGPLGIAVKVEDGGLRAVGPAAGAALSALGGMVPADLLSQPVLGGGRLRGHVIADVSVTAALSAALSP
jgi:L-asparaginase II